MEKNNFFQHKFFLLLFLMVSFANTFAQVKPLDSSSVRQDFSLPNPIRYEAFYDVQSGIVSLSQNRKYGGWELCIDDFGRVLSVHAQ